MTLNKNVFEISELYRGTPKNDLLMNARRIFNNGSRTYNSGIKIIEKGTLFIIKRITSSDEGTAKMVLKIKRKLPRLAMKGSSIFPGAR